MLRQFARDQHDELREADRNAERHPGQAGRCERQQHAQHDKQRQPKLEAQPEIGRRRQQHEQHGPHHPFQRRDDGVPLRMRRQFAGMVRQVPQRPLAVRQPQQHGGGQDDPPDRRDVNAVLAPRQQHGKQSESETGVPRAAPEHERNLEEFGGDGGASHVFV